MPVDGSVEGDAGGDAIPVDVRPVACGDGHRDPGEACYGAPLSFANDVAFEPQLADIDGDGDLDLMFADGTNVRYFAQQSGQFEATRKTALATSAAFVRAFNIGGDARLEMIAAEIGGIATFQTSGTSSVYTSAIAATEAGVKAGVLELGTITGGSTPNVISSYADKIFIGSYNTSMQLTNVTEHSVVKTSALAVGALDADAFEDIVVASVNGIVVFRGKAAGLEPVTDTSHDALANGVGIGDMDGDGVADIIFTDAGTAGTLGWMRGLGGATFAAAQTKTVADLGGDLAITDVDGDGLADVVTARVRAAPAVLVFHGRSDGTFGDAIELPLSLSIVSTLHARSDYNGDGVADIVVAQTNPGSIVVYPSTP